ncbi:hypothetical protein [Peribacillus simplex]|uniref:hypothetical protein n=1 Tax=Peribacillus simplex TaxID=1478 RepID=UPI0024C11E29|nr:hypothetical protein [Peribacillus simplex]MDR4927292.1 hypothetical protein [Peribacillus simplex]WHX92527.1 hypothetical protein QNH50_06620 [Peribacillus simplex]
MRVQEITVDNKKAYLRLDANGLPVDPVAKFMKYLHNRESRAEPYKHTVWL